MVRITPPTGIRSGSEASQQLSEFAVSYIGSAFELRGQQHEVKYIGGFSVAQRCVGLGDGAGVAVGA